MNEYEQYNGNDYLDGSDGASEASDAADWSSVNYEANSEYSAEPEILSEMPTGGCTVFYGNYLDNYASGVRRRYYSDSYGNWILNSQQNGTVPSTAVCMNESEMSSFNKDILHMMSWVIVAAVMVKVAIWVVGRFVK